MAPRFLSEDIHFNPSPLTSRVNLRLLRPYSSIRLLSMNTRNRKRRLAFQKQGREVHFQKLQGRSLQFSVTSGEVSGIYLTQQIFGTIYTQLLIWELGETLVSFCPLWPPLSLSLFGADGRRVEKRSVIISLSYLSNRKISEMTITGGSCTPGEEDDVPMSFRFYKRDDEVGGGDGLYWCVIKTKTDCCRDFSGCAYNNEKVVSPPVLKQEPSSRVSSGCVAVGGTIYVLGGMDSELSFDKPRPRNRSLVGMRTLSLPHSDVFYIDITTTTLCGHEEGGGGGWKKLDHSMNFPRSNPRAFTVNGKIYVMGGAQPSPKSEVLDTRRMDQGWRVLQDSTYVRGEIAGHAVIDGGKRICLQFRRMRHLYCYDVEADSWQVYREDVLGYPMPESRLLSWKSVFLDGILYYLDKERPGVMFGVDLDSAAAAEPKRVRLPLAKSKCEDWDWDWIPQPVLGYSDCVLPVTHLVSLGSGKLAVLWSGRGPGDELHVYRSTIKMSKEEKKQEEEGSGGDFDLVAFPLSLSHVLVHGSYLMDCIAVWP